MIRLNAVSYLNTKPFIYGLERHFAPADISIKLLIPSLCAADFAAGGSDISLLPAGSLLDFDRITLLDQYCIGANGFVDSVFLFSQQPIETLTRVYLDWHSRTSNGLAQILLRNHWRREVDFAQEEDYLHRIEGATGGVMIGDRAIAARHRFAYAYDLARAWQDYTGLPFAFAVWAYRTDALSAQVLAAINQAFEYGMQHREAVAAQYAPQFSLTQADAFQYLTQSIDYAFDARKHQALQLFLKQLAELKNQPVPAVSIV
jgi:chorismate dehydratase